jgi:hypothetical protein
VEDEGRSREGATQYISREGIDPIHRESSGIRVEIDRPRIDRSCEDIGIADLECIDPTVRITITVDHREWSE